VASAAPHPPPGVPGGMTPKPICPSTPSLARGNGRLERPTCAEGTNALEGPRVPFDVRARVPLARGVPLAWGRLRDPPRGRLVPRAPPRRGARFPEPRVLSKRWETWPSARSLSTGCCQPVDGLPAWPPAMRSALVTRRRRTPRRRRFQGTLAGEARVRGRRPQDPIDLCVRIRVRGSAITAFAVPNPNCSSQTSRFFQVWLLCRLPGLADHPIYFGLANFI